MLLKRLYITGLSLLLCAQAQSEDLFSVYQEAVRTNPQLAAAEANLRAVQESRPQAVAGLLPVVDAAGSIDRQHQKNLNEPKTTDKITNKAASLNLTQPLFHYDRWIQLKQADSAIAGAEADYAAAQQDLMLQVAQRYFDVLGAQDNLVFAEAEKSSIGRQLDQATQRFNVGLIAITDVKAAQARYDLSVSREIQAQSQLVQAKDSLREIAGRFYENVAELKAELELVHPDPDLPEAWVEQARKLNLKILAAQANSESARQEIRRQRAGHLPTLDLSANTSYFDREFGGVVPQERHDSGFGLQLNIPIYEGGLVSSRTREAQSRFEEATNRLETEVRTAEFETRDAFRGVVTDIAQVKALRESLKSTEIAVEAQEAGFEVGTRTIVDVLDAQREYFLAKLNYARARYLYVVNQLRLKKAAGILSSADLVEVNETLEDETPGP